MNRVIKKIFDNVTLVKCPKKTCTCFETFRVKNILTLTETNKYFDCYNKINKNNSLFIKIEDEDDREYPPLL